MHSLYHSWSHLKTDDYKITQYALRTIIIYCELNEIQVH